ncbi:TIGR02466 family protein [Aurantiacibacter sp. MUD11]|uniref:TIGR02466 family protein n=1 Tax=Aurantiacibacter sp. MUD11 TaxID=3003265 RepID=UPI0022AB37B9|nr:TIGR02466 family protein [Aurantiacibacter sp. MUD11]WAT18003.1 TIGR02466 family protein [Aurantiacibacter sp. MUD11]
MATAASASQRDFTVKPLFAEPYFVTNIKDAISPQQVKFIKALKMNENQVNKISEELYLFQRPEMKSIAEAVDAALQTFAREVMGIHQRLEVTQSWALTNPPGVGMHGHTHSNSLVSGSLYYAPMPDPPGNMIFERHNTYRQLEFAVDQAKTNIYNAPRNAVVPKEGDLVLFSSALQHYVEVNNSSQDRHSIAFNSFIRGKIGSFRDVSELEL